MAGVVTARGPEVGEVVAAGQMIVQIAQAGAIDAIFDVPAPVKDAATRTSTIWVSLVSDPGIRAKGTVREVSPRADPVTGTFRVRVGDCQCAAGDAAGQHRAGQSAADVAAGHHVADSGAGAGQGRHRGVGGRPQDQDRVAATGRRSAAATPMRCGSSRGWPPAISLSRQACRCCARVRRSACSGRRNDRTQICPNGRCRSARWSSF